MAADSKADSKDSKDAKEVKPPTPPPVPLTPTQEIKANLQLLERAVNTLEPRFTHRVLRGLTTLRKKLDAGVLRGVVGDVYTIGKSNDLMNELSFSHESTLQMDR
jgi:26S proteasome regulatory subunit N3